MKTNHQAPKILIVGPSWVGDMVMCQTLFMALKHVWPDCVIDVITAESGQALLTRMEQVNETLAMPYQHGELKLQDIYKLGKALRQKNYDRAIVVPRTFKAALIPFLARIPKRTGWLGEFRFGILNDIRFYKKRKASMTERILSLAPNPKTALSQDFRPKLHCTTSHVQQSFAKFGLASTEQPILAICPGAEYGPAKRWPAHHFASVATELLADNWQVWLLGSQNDTEAAQEIQARTHHRCLDFTGQTNLDEAIDLLNSANLVLCNDSGLMHVAASLNKPIVALFGSSDPSYTPPLSEKAKIVSLNLPCSPCFKRQCPYKHFDCLNKLSPQDVINTITQFKGLLPCAKA